MVSLSSSRVKSSMTEALDIWVKENSFLLLRNTGTQGQLLPTKEVWIIFFMGTTNCWHFLMHTGRRVLRKGVMQLILAFISLSNRSISSCFWNVQLAGFCPGTSWLLFRMDFSRVLSVYAPCKGNNPCTTFNVPLSLTFVIKGPLRERREKEETGEGTTGPEPAVAAPSQPDRPWTY